jgi:hypothetical protein
MCLAASLLVAGCEGYDRTRPAPRDLNEPPEQVTKKFRDGSVQMADELEQMMELRRQYLEHLTKLETLYLDQGDMARASWARRQRDETQAVTVYPYASDKAPEQRSEVRPQQKAPEADALYAEADALIQSFRKVPLAGTLKVNQDKARKAVGILRSLLQKHPQSDKVDDAAYWIGECYKEYLREEDPDNLLALRYYRWALELDPRTPHPVRFQTAVVYDFRLHDRKRSLEYYHRVIDENENYHPSNPRFAVERIAQLTDDEQSKERPRERMDTAGLQPRPARSPERADAATITEPDGEMARDGSSDVR